MNNSPEQDASEQPLVEFTFELSNTPLSEAAKNLISEARQLESQVRCFDFVPSNYENAWNVLSSLPPGRFCEWGFGLGVVTGLAALTGHEARGVELDGPLAERGRELLHKHNIASKIIVGDYLELSELADYYYVYAWPSQQLAAERRFLELAPPTGLLLVCESQDILKVMTRRSQTTQS